MEGRLQKIGHVLMKGENPCRQDEPPGPPRFDRTGYEETLKNNETPSRLSLNDHLASASWSHIKLNVHLCTASQISSERLSGQKKSDLANIFQLYLFFFSKQRVVVGAEAKGSPLAPDDQGLECLFPLFIS